jgi:hypothetical protein
MVQNFRKRLFRITREPKAIPERIVKSFKETERKSK